MIKKHFNFLCALIVTSFAFGCSSSDKVATERVEHDTQTLYQSAAGSDFMRDEIKKGMESVNRLHNTVVYRTYQFALDDLPTQAELANANLERRAAQSAIDHQSSAGTAIILRNSGGKTALVTASHVVSFPDTVWHYADTSVETPDFHVEAVSVRQSVAHYLIGPHGVYDFEVEMNDPSRDLAIMTLNWEQGNRPRLQPLQLRAGRSSDLDWTDQVYAVGFPLGTEMVTRAMVSNTGRSHRRSFVLDAAFNRGFSGGALFSERGDGTGMEWVGMVTSASAEREEYLIPQRNYDEEHRPDMEYTGAIYTHRTQRINYGITYALGVDQIKEFYNENRVELRRRGLTIPALE